MTFIFCRKSKPSGWLLMGCICMCLKKQSALLQQSANSVSFTCITEALEADSNLLTSMCSSLLSAFKFINIIFTVLFPLWLWSVFTQTHYSKDIGTLAYVLCAWLTLWTCENENANVVLNPGLRVPSHRPYGVLAHWTVLSKSVIISGNHAKKYV